MKKSVILSCPTLKKELLQAVEENGFSGSVCFLPPQLHKSPEHLKEYLQKRIDGLKNIDQILLCVSGCGGGTTGLKATSADLILPKTRDCLDILLSVQGRKDIRRPEKAIFLTEDWAEYMNEIKKRFEGQAEEKGEEYAQNAIQLMFQGFEDFYLIDTGVYDTEEVAHMAMPLIEMVHGRLHKIPGGYGILRKMTQGNFDEDFIIVKKGNIVRREDFPINTFR